MSIPKKIWTFWEGPCHQFLKHCFQAWQNHNPDYEMNVVNMENVFTFIPELKDDFFETHNIKHFSDIVRLYLLEKYGGIWVDASTICLKSLDWVLEIQEKEQVEFVGYYIDSFTCPEHKEFSPVIENWFMASIPNSAMIQDWKRKLMQAKRFRNIREYTENLKLVTDYQKINGTDYLWMHCAIQNCLQTNKGKYKFHLLKAEDGPFKYLVNTNWESHGALCHIIQGKKNNENLHLIDTPFIKLRNHERDIMCTAEWWVFV